MKRKQDMTLWEYVMYDPGELVLSFLTLIPVTLGLMCLGLIKGMAEHYEYEWFGHKFSFDIDYRRRDSKQRNY